jgi:hypothetical protein
MNICWSEGGKTWGSRSIHFRQLKIQFCAKCVKIFHDLCKPKPYRRLQGLYLVSTF